MRVQKPPKDIHKYISPFTAGARLISLALDRVLCCRPHVRVKWELKLSYYYAPDYKDHPKALVRAQSVTFSSGPEEIEEGE